MGTMITRCIILMPLLALIPTLHTIAQQDEDARGPGRRRLEEYRRMKLIEFVDMTEEQSIRYFAREKELRQAEEAIREKRAAVIARLREMSGTSISADDLEKEISTLADLAKESTQKRREFLTSLKEFLSPKQIARLIVFEEQFAHEVRRILSGARRGAPPNR
ncbi:MAG: hypothetical protein QHI48_11910 [Bacteroidota bacterium]|nr:hypothetical protein [Bacteroidota bacterium]